MKKTTNCNAENYEMLDDYSELLTNDHLGKAVRGKYAQSVNIDSSTVKIKDEDGDRYVKMKTIEVEALVNHEGNLTVQLPSNLKEGKYQAVLIVQIPC